MATMVIYIPAFVVCASIIFLAGRKLSYYGELIAERTGLGKAWIGLVLMASVTSLPELTVGISSSAIVKSADLAVGDVVGSCSFNLFILALMDAFVPRHKPIFSLAGPGHVLAAAFGIILLGMAGIGLFLPIDLVIISWIGSVSIAFIVIYFISIRIIFLNEKKQLRAPLISNSDEHSRNQNISLKQMIFRYALFAFIIVICGLTLPYLAEHVAIETGLGESFVGTLFLAMSTSMPEVAVSLAAIRIGAVDLAVGNLLGSNLFNILILAIDDIFYTKGHILKEANQNNLISVFSTILMSAVVIIGLNYRTEGKRFKLAWDALLILVIYVVNLIILYNLNK